MVKEQEKQLIDKVLKGDTSAFGYFVDTYQDMAFTIAYRICRNRQDAEDIVQESFVRAFRNLHSFKFTSKFSTWFYRVVYNTALSTVQQVFFQTDFTEYNQVTGDNDLSVFDTLAGIEEREKKKVIDRVMDMLPADEAIVLTLFYLEENSIKDVAQMMNITESNVKVKLHRSRKRFADLVGSMNMESVLR